MDADRFDALARRLGGGGSRRRLLGRAGLGALAAVLGGLGLEDAAAACARIGDSCRDRACCRSSGAKCRGTTPTCKCVGGLTACRGVAADGCPAKVCVDTANNERNCGGCGRACEPGQRCRNGRCQFPCRTDADCPAGATCDREAAACRVAVCPPGANSCTDPVALTCGEGCFCFGNDQGTICGKLLPSTQASEGGGCGPNFCADDADCVQRGAPVGSKCIRLEDRCSCGFKDCGADVANAKACVVPCDAALAASAVAADAARAGADRLGEPGL